MRITPYDLYVKFLITRGCTDITRLNETLESQFFLKVDDDTFARHFRELKVSLPAPIFTMIQKNKPVGFAFLKAMEDLGLKHLWWAQPEYSGNHEATRKSFIVAMDALEDPFVRICMRAILLKEQNDEDICTAINSKYATHLTPESVSIWRQFFWNPALMLRSDWRTYLSRVTDQTEKAALFVALSEGSEEVRAHLGLQARISTTDTLQFLASQSYAKAKHHLKGNDPNSAFEAMRWMNQTKATLGMLEKYKAGDLRDFSKELQMQFEFIETQYETPDEAVLREVKEKNPASKEELSEKDAENTDENPKQDGLGLEDK